MAENIETLVALPQPAADLYETDFYRWLHENAALLREGRFAEADIPNIVEELECLARGERRSVREQLAVLLLHLLKWEFQPDQRGSAWRLAIHHARDTANDLLKDSPSLWPQVPGLLADGYEQASDHAVLETELPESYFPEDCPYTLEQVLNAEFWPGDL